MDEIEKPEEKKPWWNDADKMGGLCATLIVLGVIGFFIILAWGWAWHLAFG